MRVLSAELYQLRKAAAFKWILLGTAAYAFTDVYSIWSGIYEGESGLSAFWNSIIAAPMLLVLCVIFSGVFNEGGFERRVTQMEIAMGNKRSTILTGKILTFWLSAILILWMYQFVSIAGVSAVCGFGMKFSLHHVMFLLKVELIYVIEFSSMLFLGLLLAVCIRKTYVAVAVGSICFLILDELLRLFYMAGGFLQKIYQISPIGCMTRLSAQGFDLEETVVQVKKIEKLTADFGGMEMWGKDLFCCISFAVVFVLISYLVFQKADLK